MTQGHGKSVSVTVIGALAMWTTPAFAYLGPGTGLSAIGAFIALILGVILAFVGFIWYPIKRLIRKGRAAGVSARGPQPNPDSVEEGA